MERKSGTPAHGFCCQRSLPHAKQHPNVCKEAILSHSCFTSALHQQGLQHTARVGGLLQGLGTMGTMHIKNQSTKTIEGFSMVKFSNWV